LAKPDQDLLTHPCRRTGAFQDLDELHQATGSRDASRYVALLDDSRRLAS